MPENFRALQFLFLATAAASLVSCSKPSPIATATPPETNPSISLQSVSPEPETVRATIEEPVSLGEPVPVVETPEESEVVDVGALERRFLGSANDPQSRIEAVKGLTGVEPVAALAVLNRLFPVERREDVKMEILSTLSDLDHERDRDNQLALCSKALAPDQPARVRYVAVHVLTDLGDPRARALLLGLKSDQDRDVRAAAAQALRDLEPALR